MKVIKIFRSNYFLAELLMNYIHIVIKATFIKEMHDNIINVTAYMICINLNIFELQIIKLKTNNAPSIDT